MKKKKLVLDCERMKYPHTGLFHYCLQLGTALKAKIDNELEFLSFYVRKNELNIFGNDSNYLQQKSTNKFFMPVKDTVVWHCTYQATNYFPFRKKVKIVFTIHDLNVLHENQMTEKRLNKELAKIQKRINRADHIVAISEFTLSDIKKHLDIGNTPTSVIYNGCNFTLIENPTTPSVAVNSEFLFTIGTINAKKNFHVLPCLLVGNEKMLVIAGITDDELYKKKIIEQSVLLGVEDRVLFTGSINENDKQWYFKNCEAFVFPSLAEGFGLPVIEAMYFGKPVVLSNLTSLPEVGGAEAFYFNNFEPEDMREVLAVSLEKYNNDKHAKEKIAARAALFNWDNTAQQYLAVYRSLY
jgi:glycosyltransferase involved in cell wall biosynthesis